MSSAREWARAEAELDAAPLGRFVTPSYLGRSLPNLTSTLWRSAGHEGDAGGAWPLLPPLAPELDPTEGRRTEGTILLLLVDGMGWGHFRRAVEAPSAAGGSPIPDAWAERARPITSVFPSTTTSALTSLSTGVAPSSHGIVGHRQYLPRWGVVADMLRMSPMSVPGLDSLVGSEWTRRELTPVPTIFERGLAAAVLTRDRFAGSGFTRLLYSGAEFHGYATASELAYQLIRLLGQRAPPGVIFLYWDELDLVHHLRGPESYLYELELERLASLLRSVAGRLEASRRKQIALWITGDHGLVPATPESNVPLDRHPDVLSELVHPPAGDRRAGFFATRSGREGSVTRRLEALLPDGSRVAPLDEALRLQLFGPGPPHPELEVRTGNLLALPAAPAGFTYLPPGVPTPRRHLHGAHGGLDRGELWVPLIAGGLDELTRGG